MAYPRIDGSGFDRAAYVARSAGERTAFTSSLARSLVSIQDALAATSTASPLPLVDLTEFYAPVREHLGELPAQTRSEVGDLLDEYAEIFLADRDRTPVALHNDFHFGNLVLDPSSQRVIGLWDFSCVATGVAEWDLRYLEGDLASPWDTPVHMPGEHHDLLQRVARSYGELRGVDVDVRACVVANRVEALFDLGADRAVDALQGWARWDAEAHHQ